MKTVIHIGNKEYGFCRPIGGNFQNKFNRAVKLAVQFESLVGKFDRMISKGNGTSQQARLALACKLMMTTGIRVGNEGSAEGYMTKPHPKSKVKPQFVKTYGLTTLLPEHIIVAPRKVCLNFVGKKSVENSFRLTGKLAKQVRFLLDNCESETLFDISAYKLTKFIQTYCGKNFTPKDFRTMKANMCAYEMLMEINQYELPTTKREAAAEMREIAVYVSENLNNTPGVCKASYIDPKFWDEASKLRK